VRKPRPEIWLLLGSVVITLLVAEFVVSRLFPQATYSRLLRDSPRMFAASDVMPYALAPGAVDTLVTWEFKVPIRINSLGYRDDEFPMKRTARLRILAIGDSFTFGYAGTSDEAYPNVVERELREKLGTDDIEVINAGLAACNYPDTYYLYLKTRGLALDPDLITVGIFVGNDLDHDLAGEYVWPEVDAAGLPLRIQDTVAHVEHGYWMSRNRAWRHRLPIVRESHLAQALISFLRSAGPDQPRTFNQWMYRRGYEERTTQAVAKVETLFSAMASLAAARGIPIVFVVIPTREQISPEDYDFSKYPFMAGYDLDKPERVLAEFFESRGMTELDLLPVFRQAPRDTALYYAIDQHWNERGNALAGRAIAEFLVERGLVTK
jgi:lysophospholipase L1-like esterase